VIQKRLEGFEMTLTKVWLLLGLSIALAACESTTGGGGDADSDVDADADSDSDADSDADADADSDADSDADTCDVMDDGGGGCGAGECCYLDDGEAPVCVAGGVATQGEDCAAADACSCGFTCIGPAAGQTTCAHWCAFGVGAGSDANCPIGSLCVISLASQVNEGAVLGMVCKIPDLCDPLVQDCDAGDACYVLRDDGTADCYAPGDHAPGDPCEYLNDCGVGYACVSAGASNMCLKYCNFDNGNADCTDPGFGTCTDQTMQSPTGAEIGVCTPDA
jgi:hypothetical protein